MIRLVVADDQPVICAGFAALLAAQPDMAVVGTAHDGRALVALVEAERPDVALVDVRMPELDGIEATRLICRDSATTRVLVLTTFDLDAYVYDALRAGASGFLLKDVTAERLVDGCPADRGRLDRLLGPGGEPPPGGPTSRPGGGRRVRSLSYARALSPREREQRRCSSSPGAGRTPRSPRA